MIIEKIGLYLGIGLAFIIPGLIIFSTNGVMDYRVLKEKERMITRQVEAASKENERLINEINCLRYDLKYIGHKARHEHGMATSDVIIIKFQPGSAGDGDKYNDK
ncbi:MAG: septum formation initiator [Desulfobacterales bacterium]|nr:MAG: septum formation initiator [Desulfobacterales bacterium]